MIRSIIPLIAVLFFSLSLFSVLFSPIEVGGALYILVPRFVIVFLIFIAVYYSQTTCNYLRNCVWPLV